jgi:hypothetical protein
MPKNHVPRPRHPFSMPTLGRCLSAFLLGSLGVGSTAQPAFSQLAVAHDDVIRIRGGSEELIIGSLMKFTGDTLFVEERDGSVQAVPFSSLLHLEVLKETFPGTSRAPLYGWLITTAAGAGMGALVWSPCTSRRIMDCMLTPSSRTSSAGRGAILGGLVGLSVAKGLRPAPTEVWVEGVLVDPRARERAEPWAPTLLLSGTSRGGVQLRVTLPIP